MHPYIYVYICMRRMFTYTVLANPIYTVFGIYREIGTLEV